MMEIVAVERLRTGVSDGRKAQRFEISWENGNGTELV